MTAEIVKLHESPPLNDIVSQLRKLADHIENGEVEADGAFLLIPRPGDYPTVYGWGDVTGRNDPAVQFELARMWLMMNLVHRI